MLYNTGGARTKDACTREAERDNWKTRCARNEGRNGVFVAMGGGQGGEGRSGAYVGGVRNRDIEFTPFLFWRIAGCDTIRRGLSAAGHEEVIFSF